jgi:hypothetical protein
MGGQPAPPPMFQMGYGAAKGGGAARVAPYGGKGGSSGGKTRPGDWMCPSCNNHNYADKVACNKCGNPKAVGAQAFGAPGQARPGDWMCPSCNNHNYASKAACNRCGGAKPNFPQAPPMQFQQPQMAYQPQMQYQPPPMQYQKGGPPFGQPMWTPVAQGGQQAEKRPGDWTCLACKNVNYANRTECNKCKIPKSTFIAKTGLRPGDWICPGCQNHNYASKMECVKCQAPKQDSYVHISKMREGDWLCASCNNHNYADKTVCNRCKIAKM